MKPKLQLAAVACCLLLPTLATAQVTASTTLSAEGLAAVRIANPTTDIFEVSVELFHDATLPEGPVSLGALVAGVLISPATFQLGPGEQQVVRIRVRLEEVQAGETLRVVTSLTRASSQRQQDGSEDVVRIGLELRTRPH